jgi:putative ABC transport system ATP-binding protein
LDPAIHTESLCRYYTMGAATIRAVDGITLDISAGEFVALLGASGSGKSSLLNLIAGLDSPTSGGVISCGKDLAKLSREGLARYRRHEIGMVFQSFNLIPRMSVLENVELPLRFAEVDRGKRTAQATRALSQVGLSGRLEHRPAELSGGEQQRVALARALVNGPRILLADEPTGNLDSHTGIEVMELICGLNRSLHMTVLLVTHEQVLAEKYACRLVSLADGKVFSDQPNSKRAAGLAHNLGPMHPISEASLQPEANRGEA